MRKRLLVHGAYDWQIVFTHPDSVLYVLNINCGPIHKRRWGPAWVIISTCDNHRSSRSPSVNSLSHRVSARRSLSNQLSDGTGG